MTYATQQDLIDRFGQSEIEQVADRDGDSAIDAAVTAAALGDADKLIDGYVAGRYGLPLATVPPLIVALACDIARYKLHKDQPPETVRNNYQDALRQLRDIAAGTLKLDVAGVEPARSGDAILIDAPDREFTHDTLKGL